MNKRMPLNTSTVRKQGMAMKSRAAMDRGGGIPATKARTRSSASDQCSSVKGMYASTHKGPMNGFGSKTGRM